MKTLSNPCKRGRFISLITLFCGCSLLLFSCLDEDPRDQLEEEQAYDTASNLYINTVATLYNYIGGSQQSQGLQGTYRGVYDYNTFTTDEAMLPTRGGDWYDGGFWQNLYLHKWTESDDALSETWNYLYKVIVLCNRSLANIEKHQTLLTNSQKMAYEAEVRAIRAMYYYYLVDMFGSVPLVVSDEISIQDVKQSSRSEVFSFAFDELQEVLPLLPDEHSNLMGDYYGRITRPVAYFLLAKLALNAEIFTDNDWTDAAKPSGKDIKLTVDGKQMNAWEAVIAYCDKIEAAGYQLEGNYQDNFAVHNENSKENIFVIPMEKTLYANQYQYLFRSRHYVHGSAIGMDAENGTSATLSTVKTYGYGTDEEDTRYAINFYSDTLKVDGEVVYLDSGDPLIYMPLEIKLDLSGSKYEKTAGARMSKYAIDRTSHADGKLQENDIVLYRYADVLLMKAEALWRNGNDGNEIFNKIRERAGMEDRELTEDNLLDERLMELMWEGWRRQDLVRFGRFHKSYDMRPQLKDEESAYTTVFPIPGSVLDTNSNIKQNPGY